jgi:hypothetical protein
MREPEELPEGIWSADPSKFEVRYVQDKETGVLVLTERRKHGWKPGGLSGADCVDGPLDGRTVLVWSTKPAGVRIVDEEYNARFDARPLIRVEGDDSGAYRWRWRETVARVMGGGRRVGSGTPAQVAYLQWFATPATDEPSPESEVRDA